MCGILGLVMVLGLLLTSCTDDIVEGGMGRDEDASVKGQMILFAAGTTENAMGTRAEGNGGVSVAPGKTYYMPHDYRFVCRMYYKASTDANAKFDVEGGSDITVWMKVKGDVGNSLYWRNNFADLGTTGPFDTFGNDAAATCLYWQNRKEHAFLAWTDLNKAKTNTYSPDKNSGALKFVPADEEYVKHTGEKRQQWVNAGFELYAEGVSNPQEFKTWEKVRTYIETGTNYEDHMQGKTPEGITAADFQGKQYYYSYGWSCKYSMVMAATEPVGTDGKYQKVGWIQYQMFYDKLQYSGPTTGDNIEVRRDSKNKPAYLYDKDANKYLAEIEYDKDDPDETLKWKYYLTDEYGNVRYDENTPRYTFYFKVLQEKKEQEVVTVLPANVFDLTHQAGFRSIADQPDICQALTVQAPLGATQNANRVNLYFKHQFSQVQVNLKGSADLSVIINKNHIKKVELLGVSEKGYVFTEIDEDGEVEPSTYESVDISKYTDEQLQNNPYGTSFEMFDMANGQKNYEYPTGYLKAYNAITFGQLQAIRVTWNEAENGSGISHVSTYHVADDNLRNLKSGYKYIWNIELRRGTLAIVRTEIVDWIVPVGELEYTTDGTIATSNNP